MAPFRPNGGAMGVPLSRACNWEFLSSQHLFCAALPPGVEKQTWLAARQRFNSFSSSWPHSASGLHQQRLPYTMTASASINGTANGHATNGIASSGLRRAEELDDVSTHYIVT